MKKLQNYLHNEALVQHLDDRYPTNRNRESKKMVVTLKTVRREIDEPFYHTVVVLEQVKERYKKHRRKNNLFSSSLQVPFQVLC